MLLVRALWPATWYEDEKDLALMSSLSQAEAVKFGPVPARPTETTVAPDV
jgi:hypothetical protein